MIAYEAVAAIFSYISLALGFSVTVDLKKSANLELVSISGVLCNYSTTLKIALIIFYAFSELYTLLINFKFF